MSSAESTEGIVVSVATEVDVDSVAPMYDSYRAFYRAEPDPEGSRRFLRERLSRGESIVLVARSRGEPVGFLQIYPSFSSVAMRPILVVNDLFVRPEARRRGVGFLLLEEAKRQARDRGAVRLSLSTQVTNEAAQALYRANGWVRQDDFFVFTFKMV